MDAHTRVISPPPARKEVFAWPTNSSADSQGGDAQSRRPVSPIITRATPTPNRSPVPGARDVGNSPSPARPGRRPFPIHWGEPPALTPRSVQSPGASNEAIAKWVQDNLERDAATLLKGAKPSGAFTPSGFSPKLEEQSRFSRSPYPSPLLDDRPPPRAFSPELADSRVSEDARAARDVGRSSRPLSHRVGTSVSPGPSLSRRRAIGDNEHAPSPRSRSANIQWDEAATGCPLFGHKKMLMGVRTMRLQMDCLEELQQTLVNRVGYFSGIFHAWVNEVQVSRLVRIHEEELRQHQRRLHLEVLEREQRFARWNWRHTELLLRHFLVRAAREITSIVMTLWQTHAREMREKGDRALGFIAKLAITSQFGILSVAWNAWQEDMRDARAKEERCKIAERAAAKWFQQEAEDSVVIVFSAWRQRAHVTAKSLSVLGLTSAKGLVAMSWKGWKDYVFAVRQHNDSVQRTQSLLAQNTEAGLLNCYFKAIQDFVRFEKQARQEAKSKEWESNRTNTAVQRFMQADRLGAASFCFQSWKEEVKTRVQQSITEDLQRQNERLLMVNKSQAEQATKQYLQKWIFGHEKGLKVEVLQAWYNSATLEKKKARDKKNVESVLMQALGAQQSGFLECILTSWHHRVCMLQQEQQIVMKAFASINMRNSKDILVEAFAGWVKGFRRQKRSQVSDTVFSRTSKQDLLNLQRMVLREFMWACRTSRMEYDNGEARRLRASLEERLWMAYSQVDEVSEALQRELQTKEGLASKLRDAYGHMRRAGHLAGSSPPHAKGHAESGSQSSSPVTSPGMKEEPCAEPTHPSPVRQAAPQRPLLSTTVVQTPPDETVGRWPGLNISTTQLNGSGVNGASQITPAPTQRMADLYSPEVNQLTSRAEEYRVRTS